jgi:uncharacterized membrane protein YjjP (DUF1212 family)
VPNFTEDQTNLPTDARLALALATALHAAGAPAHRLEAMVDAVCAPLHLDTQCFATPTAIFLQVGGQVQLLRVRPGDADLERLVRLDRLGAQVARSQVSSDQALALLTAEGQRPDRYSPGLMTAALGVSSGITALLFGGGWVEVAVAGALAAVAGLLAGWTAARPNLARVFPLFAGAGAGAIAGLVAGVVPVAPERIALAALIVFVPGLSLTTAMAEVATWNLSAGTMRLAGAGVVLLQLGLGTSTGLAMASAVVPPLQGALASPASALGWALLPLVGASLGVLFKARPADLLAVVVACTLGFAGAQLAVSWAGPLVGPGLAAFALAAASNLHARWRDVPASVTLLPAILLLVPGAMGFESVQALTSAQTVQGLQAGTQMLLVAASLVAGLLAATAMVPAKRAL